MKCAQQLPEILYNSSDLNDEVRNLFNFNSANNLTTTSDYRFTYFYNLLPSAQVLLENANNFLKSDELFVEQASVFFRHAKLKLHEFEKIPDGFKPEFYMKIIETKESLILLLEDLNNRYKITEPLSSYPSSLTLGDLPVLLSNKLLHPSDRISTKSDDEVVSQQPKEEPRDSESPKEKPRDSELLKHKTPNVRKERSDSERKRFERKELLSPINQAKYFIKMLTACDDILAEVENSKEKTLFHFKKYFGTSVKEYTKIFKLPNKIEEPLPLSDPNHIYHTFQYPDIVLKTAGLNAAVPPKFNIDMDHLIPTSVYRIPHFPTKTKCLFCNGAHWTYLCTIYPTLEMRLHYFQANDLCKICGTQHSDKCFFTDRYCRWPHCAARGKHNSALCPNASYPITSEHAVTYLERIKELQRKFPQAKGKKSVRSAS